MKQLLIVKMDSYNILFTFEIDNVLSGFHSCPFKLLGGHQNTLCEPTFYSMRMSDGDERRRVCEGVGLAGMGLYPRVNTRL